MISSKAAMSGVYDRLQVVLSILIAISASYAALDLEQIRKIKHGRFVLLPISDVTRGHGTNSYPPAWKQYLAEY